MADRSIDKKDMEVPKRDAMTEGLLRQFLNTDGPKGGRPEYRSGWDRVFGPWVCEKCGGGGRGLAQKEAHECP